MRKILLISIICLFLFVNSINALTTTYNFNSTYEGINSFAWRGTDNTNPDSSNPPNNLPPSGTLVNTTNNSALDSSDNNYITNTISSSNLGFYYFIFNTSIININDITNITPYVEFKTDETLSRNYYWFIFNISAGDWYLLQSQNINSFSGDITSKNSILSNTSDFNNNSIYLLFTESDNNAQTLSVDFVKLEITYSSSPIINLSQPVNNTNSSKNINYFVCNSSDNYGLKNITLYLYNPDDTINQTNSTLITGLTNSVNLSLNIQDGTFKWNCLGYNTQDNYDWDINRTITIDTTPPNINIKTPLDYETFSYKDNININFIRSDSGLGLSSCWYSNDSGLSNFTLSLISNFTINETGSGDYITTIWCNDTLNNINSTLVHYTVSLGSPAITKNFPTNNLFLNYLNNIYFNYTATDGNGLSTCELWGNWSNWYKNYTWVNPNSGVMNYTLLNLSEGSYLYNIWCNDTTSQGNFSSSNFTFTLDITYPEINISKPVTILGSQTFTFDFNASDKNINTCKYSIFNSSGGIDGIYNNISVICNSIVTSATVSTFGNYNLTIYAIDKAGNENSSTIELTIIDLISTGGGVGGSSTISVVAIKNPINLSKTDLDRAILYSLIRKKCNNNTECKLNKTYEDNIIQIFSSYGLIIFKDDLNKWLENYNNNELQSVQLSENDVVKYDLFTGVLSVISGKFKITPPNLDTFIIILFSKEFNYELKGNKIISNFSIDGEYGFTVERKSDSIMLLKFKVENLNFFSKTFKSNLEVTDEKGETIFIPITIRAVNLISINNQIILFLFSSIFIFGFIFRDKIIIYSKNLFKSSKKLFL